MSGGAEGLPLSFDDPCLHHADSRTAFERGLVPGVVPDSILKYTLVSFMLWITLVLYTKWNWGVHVTDRKVRSRNNMQMLLLLILLFLLATIL